MNCHQAGAALEHHDILARADLFFAAHGAFRLPKVREHRPCTAKGTAYGTTLIGKPVRVVALVGLHDHLANDTKSRDLIRLWHRQAQQQ